MLLYRRYKILNSFGMLCCVRICVHYLFAVFLVLDTILFSVTGVESL